MVSNSSKERLNLSDSIIRRLSCILTSSTPAQTFPELSEIPSELPIHNIEEPNLSRNYKMNLYDQLIHQNYQQVIEALNVVEEDRRKLQLKLKDLLYRVDEEITLNRQEIFKHRANKLHFHLISKFLAKARQENEHLEYLIHNKSPDMQDKQTQTDSQVRSAIPPIRIQADTAFKSSRIPLIPLRFLKPSSEKENYLVMNLDQLPKMQSFDGTSNISNILNKSDSSTKIPKPSCKS